MEPTEDLAGRLGKNVAALRQMRSQSQAQLAKLAGIPRATWAHLESGAANPTLAVLHKVAGALQVSIEELVSPPRHQAKLHPSSTLAVKQRGQATIRKLLPDPIPGMEIDRIELPQDGRMIGVPHTAGTTEYLMCEKGKLELVASGESYVLEVGDVVVFRGDQKHSYRNAGKGDAVGYSVVLIARIS